MNTTARRITLCAGIAAGLIIVLAGALLAFLTVTEYRPPAVEPAAIQRSAEAETESPQFSDARQPPLPASPATAGRPAEIGIPLKLLSWNIGYASLDDSQDFFMDGGRGVRPPDSSNVKRNLAGIREFITAAGCDILLIQEVDRSSYRSYYVDQTAFFTGNFPGASAFALNFHCRFVPYPFPEFIGKVSSGILTMSAFDIREALRVSVPTPFTWPVRTANLKRCLLVSRIPVAGSPAELVVVNFHLEAYESSGGKEAQTRALLGLLYGEYAKGNYCIAGGDFNQNFPGIDADRFAVKNSDYFVPGALSESLLEAGWRFAADPHTPSARLLNEPYSGNTDATQLYVIDGFIVSPNIDILAVQAFDRGFKYTDHNPVQLTASLKPGGR